MTQEEIDRSTARLAKACRKSGAKLTHQRMEVFREVAQSAGHPDAAAVFKGVRGRLPTVSMDTVYRALWWLKDLGFITLLWPRREGTRFDANLKLHHHFVCTGCGIIRDFFSDDLDSLDLPESVLSIGNPEKTRVEARGLCLSCAASGKTDAA